MTLKEDIEEMSVITENKKIDDYKIIRKKVEYVLADYYKQRDGLEFRRTKLKNDSRSAIALMVIFFIVLFVVSVMCIILPILIVPAILIGIVMFAVFPFIFGSMIKRIVYNIIMNEKLKNLDIITKRKIKTFNAEERFLDRKIKEYTDSLNKADSYEKIPDEYMLELESLLYPEEFHSSSTIGEFKLWPFYAVMGVWVFMLLFVLAIS